MLQQHALIRSWRGVSVCKFRCMRKRFQLRTHFQAFMNPAEIFSQVGLFQVRNKRIRSIVLFSLRVTQQEINHLWSDPPYLRNTSKHGMLMCRSDLIHTTILQASNQFNSIKFNSTLFCHVYRYQEFFPCKQNNKTTQNNNTRTDSTSMSKIINKNAIIIMLNKVK